MASKLSLPDKDFCCSVCRDVYEDPVLLSCSHSFCKHCLQTWWREKQGECPLCRRRSSKSDPPGNLALKNLCQAFLHERHQRASAESELLCRLHGGKFTLFCLDDQQPACLLCRDSKQDTDHRFRPIGEAALDHRKELESALKPLREKLLVFNKFKHGCDKSAECIKAQTQQTARQIKEEFKQLHQFLREEEQERLAALMEEEEQKCRMTSETIERLSREISTLSDTIKATEEELGTDDISFLQDYKATIKRVQCSVSDPQPVTGALIDMAKHLGNLTFRVWEKMQGMVSCNPVTLDPNSAHPDLLLSEDLTSVRWSTDRQQTPDNPERFDRWIQVLGSEGFNSGTHRFDVEVGDNTNWIVGMTTESVRRKGDVEGTCWRLGLYYGKYNGYSSAGLNIDLPVSTKPRRIRMILDWNRGKLSFFDPDTDTQLHTFTHTFTERLFVYIGTVCSLSPLRILPVSVKLVT
ncbi:E3 ubiquitin-protein ligase TRIM39-like [Diretmus argenteus]